MLNVSSEHSFKLLIIGLSEHGIVTKSQLARMIYLVTAFAITKLKALTVEQVFHF